MNDTSFGSLLREFRCAAGLSQEALAERARLSPGAISSLERSARRGPQHQTLSLLAEALKLGPAQRAQLEEAAVAGRHRRVRASADPRALPKHNLPNSLTSFYGRAADLAQLERLAWSRSLVTLVGSAGVGKTRLALELAWRLVQNDRFSHGVWQIDLAPLASPELLTSTIARILNVSQKPHEALVMTLSAAIAPKTLVLLLDNCEHLLQECAQVTEVLLAAAPGIVVLTTTREALRIDGECVFRVLPLPLDEGRVAGPALDLFIDRLTDTDFVRFSTISKGDRAHALTICRRLDGVPLALELAAGRARDLPLSDIAAGLDERFTLLGDGRRTASPRQYTLRGMIDWSFALLTEREQECFARLGLFPEAFMPEAASEICGDDPAGVRDALGALIAKSLVGVIEDAEGRLRYRLLETMRAYALDRLREGGEYNLYARRFAGFYCARATSADAMYGLIAHHKFLALVEADLDNFRLALEWTLGQRNDVVLGAKLAGAMGWAYRQTMLFAEGMRWAERGLAESAQSEPVVIGRLHMARSFFLFNLGDLKAAFEAATAATDVYRISGRRSDLSWSLTQEAYCLYLLGQSAKARAAGDAAVSVAREEGDVFRLAGALNAVALTIPIERVTERFAPLEEAIRCYRAAGDADAIVAIANLAEAHYATGNYAAALAYGSQLVALTRVNRDRSNLASALINLAAYALTSGDLAQADGAAREVLESVRELGKTLHAMLAFQHLATVAARRGAYVPAARLVGASNRLYREFGLEREFTEQLLYDQTIDEIGTALNREALGEHLEKGAALSVDIAIAEALSSLER